jgi:hypothetical protein
MAEFLVFMVSMMIETLETGFCFVFGIARPPRGKPGVHPRAGAGEVTYVII